MISETIVKSHINAKLWAPTRGDRDIVVSILDTNTVKIFNQWPWAHVLRFDDVDPESMSDLDLTADKPLTIHQARSLRDFLTRWHLSLEPVRLIAHCWAGVSRSAGVAHFLHQTWRIPYRTEQRYFYPNPWVVEQLQRAGVTR